MQITNASSHLLVSGQYKTGTCSYVGGVITDSSNLLTQVDEGKMISLQVGTSSPIFNIIESVTTSSSNTFTLRYNMDTFASAEYIVFVPIEEIFDSYPSIWTWYPIQPISLRKRSESSPLFILYGKRLYLTIVNCMSIAKGILN